MILVRRSSRLLVLVVVDLGELRVDHVILATGAGLGGVGFGLLLVHGLAEFHRSLRQRVGLGLDRLGIVALQRLLQVADGILYGAALGFRDLRTVLGQRLLGRVHQRVGMVLGVYRLAAFLVGRSIGFRVLDHFVDVGLR